MVEEEKHKKVEKYDDAEPTKKTTMQNQLKAKETQKIKIKNQRRRNTRNLKKTTKWERRMEYLFEIKEVISQSNDRYRRKTKKKFFSFEPLG